MPSFCERLVNRSKKEQILDSALTLFSANGIDATSTASIAKAAKVANGTLFHHFDNKQTLVHQLYLSIKHDLSQQFELAAPQDNQNLETIACQLWNSALDWAIAFPQKLRFFQLVAASQLLSSEEKANAMAQELGVIMELITVGQQTGEFADHPTELLALNCQGQFFSASNFFIDNPKLANDPKYRHATFCMFWNALRPLIKS